MMGKSIRYAAPVALAMSLAVPGTEVVRGATEATAPVEAGSGLDALETDNCVSCLSVVGEQSCPPDYHYAWDGENDPWTRNGGAHLDGLCRSGTCDTTHGPLCDFEGEGFGDDLATLASSSSAARIADLTGSYPGRILLNRQRSAVQLTGCDGLVIRHIPVSRDVLAAPTASELF
jgi:hypothetical protein